MRFNTYLTAILISTSSLLFACDTKDGVDNNDDPINDTTPGDTNPGDDDDDDDTNPGDPQTQSYSGYLASTGTQNARASGSVDLSSATMIEIWSYSDSGEATHVGEGSVEADGSFEVEVETDDETDSDDDYTILHALDADGSVVASALLEGMSDTDSDELMSRLDVESTIETWAFIERTEDEGDADSANYSDIRSRIDSALAVEVYEAFMSSDDEGEDAMSALTAALEAALEAEILSYNDSGWSGDSADMYGLESSISQSLTATLSSTSADADDAYATFFADLQAALEAEGMTSEDRYDAESAAALAFRLTLDALLSGESDLEEEGERSSFMLEAYHMVDFIVESTSENGDGDSAEFIADLTETLWVDLMYAVSSDETEDLWADYSYMVLAEVDTMLDLVSYGGGDLDNDGDYDLFDDILDGDLSSDVSLESILEGEGEGLFEDLEEDLDGSSSEDDAMTSVMFWSELDASIETMVEDADGWTQSELVADLILSVTGNYYRSES